MSAGLNVFLAAAVAATVAGCHAAGADNFEAARLVLQQFLRLNLDQQVQSASTRELLTGEALETWNTPSIGPIHGQPDKIIQVRPGFLAARVPAIAPTGEVKDFYFYLSGDSGWKVAGMRTLASIGILYEARDALAKNPGAVEDPEFERKNLDLTLASDAELRRWFQKNQARLETLARSSEGIEADALRRELGVAHVERMSQGSVQLTIGGVVDNTVGLLFSPNVPPPTINPREYIWVEEVAPGWYVFRTT